MVGSEVVEGVVAEEEVEEEGMDVGEVDMEVVEEAEGVEDLDTKRKTITKI